MALEQLGLRSLKVRDQSGFLLQFVGQIPSPRRIWCHCPRSWNLIWEISRNAFGTWLYSIWISFQVLSRFYQNHLFTIWHSIFFDYNYLVHRKDLEKPWRQSWDLLHYKHSWRKDHDKPLTYIPYQSQLVGKHKTPNEFFETTLMI